MYKLWAYSIHDFDSTTPQNGTKQLQTALFAPDHARIYIPQQLGLCDGF